MLAGDGDPAERRPPAGREPGGQAGGAVRSPRAPRPACRRISALRSFTQIWEGMLCERPETVKGSWLIAASLLRVQERS